MGRWRVGRGMCAGTCRWVGLQECKRAPCWSHARRWRCIGKGRALPVRSQGPRGCISEGKAHMDGLSKLLRGTGAEVR